MFSYVVTFWLGLLLIGGLSLAIGPLPRELGVSSPAILAPVGWLLMFASVGYVAAAGLHLGPIRFRRVELPLPAPHLAIGHLVISVLEWTIAGAALYELLPAGASLFRRRWSVRGFAAARARQPHSRRNGNSRGGASLDLQRADNDALPDRYRIGRFTIRYHFQLRLSCSSQTSSISGDHKQLV